MTEDSQSTEELQDFHIITIMFEKDKAPRVDLGNLSPWLAAALLRSTTEALEATLHPPTITYDGEVIFDVSFGDED